MEGDLFISATITDDVYHLHQAYIKGFKDDKMLEIFEQRSQKEDPEIVAIELLNENGIFLGEAIEVTEEMHYKLFHK